MITLLRPWQVEPAKWLTDILKSGQNGIDLSDCGVGKCLGKGTRVLMFDGSVRMVETVVVGEELMGDDGTPRKVLQISQGVGPLFKITPKGSGKANSWICNAEHVLVLHNTGQGGAYREVMARESLEIALSEWRQLPRTEQTHRWKMFYSPGWERPEASLAVAPYIYGLWLGDGAISHGGLTTADAEIKEAWLAYFLSDGYRMREDAQKGNAATTFIPIMDVSQKPAARWVWDSRRGRAVWRKRGRRTTKRGMAHNSWRTFTAQSVNQKEKFIYPEYLNSCRAQRLQLLAGLLDSDGHLCHGLNTFEISQKSERLSEQICFLARSLGFKVSVRRNYKTCQTGGGGWYFRMCISGDTEAIPTILPRKKATKRSAFKQSNIFGFLVEAAGAGEYFGFVIDGNRRFLLHDFTVTHNTAHAAHVIAELNLPTVVICPKISCTAWEQMLERFSAKASVVGWEQLRTGKTGFGVWSNPPPAGAEREVFFQCEVCLRRLTLEDGEVGCVHHPEKIHCVTLKKKPWRYGRFVWSGSAQLVVADEIHRANALDSLNADLIIGAVKQNIRLLGLSATAGSSPTHFRALGFMLGLHSLDMVKPGLQNWTTWAYRFGCRYQPQRGLQWLVSAESQKKLMKEIHSDILPARGVRVRVEGISGFPECEVTAEAYDLPEPEKLNALYATLAAPLADLAERSALDAAPDLPITAQLRARQKIELLKTEILSELTDDFLTKGFSVALFVNFKATIEILAKRFKTDCVIDGSPRSVEQRALRIGMFQQNVRPVIICNSQAAGQSISLHDEAGGHPRVGLVSPSFSAVTFRQVLGRLHRAGSKSKALYRIVFVAKSIETKIQRAVQAKLSNLDALSDGDLLPQ